MTNVNKITCYSIGSTDYMPLEGGEVIFDSEDQEKVLKYNWKINKNGYVRTTNGRLALHNIIMNVEKHSFSREVDHINRNKLDNRKSNLRLVSRQINNLNTGNQKNNKSSGLKGVCWHKQQNKWRAYIMLDWKQIHLGLFDTIEEAYKVRLEYENKLLNELLDRYNKEQGITPYDQKDV